jgi:hypothetical protein
MAETQTRIPRFVVMDAAAPMPNSCWGTYRRVAVVETDGEHLPRQIHPRHRAVRRIVRTWERQHVGKTCRSAFYEAKRAAQALADRLNGKA